MSLKICIPAMAAFLLAACGDGNKAGDPDPSAEADLVVDSFDDLSVCIDDREGATAYVKGEDNAYICTNGGWTINTNADTRKKSSSSSAKSSGSKQSSGPVLLAKPCKTGTEDNCEYGELVDARDGQTYKTVKIGDQWWMAKNLNYKVDSSFCFNDSVEYCEKYGRLYTWAVAMDSVGTWSSNGKGCGLGKICLPKYPVRGICPEGWHLPDTTEWEILVTAVGGRWIASRKLKSQTGRIGDGNGSDAYGFSVLPAGRLYYDRHEFSGGNTSFWCATEDAYDDVNTSSIMDLCAWCDNIYYPLPFRSDKNNALSVRCLKDEAVSNSNSASKEKSSSNSNDFDWNVLKEEYFNPAISYGTMTDPRDGQTYKTVKLDDQVWMAENLNYYDATLDGRSWCYGAITDATTLNCAVPGRFYTWAAAIDSAKLYNDKSIVCGYGSSCSLPDTVYGICPPGWHLPSEREWEVLLRSQYVRGVKDLISRFGWVDNEGKRIDGSNSCGFSALPAGKRSPEGLISEDGSAACFWSASQTNIHEGDYMCIGENKYEVSLGKPKTYGLSVRCLQD